MPLRPQSRRLESVELRIVSAVRRAKRMGYEPRRLYLSPEDRDELAAAHGREVREVGGLEIRPAARTSRLFCKHGIDVSLRRPARRPPQ